LNAVIEVMLVLTSLYDLTNAPTAACTDAVSRASVSVESPALIRFNVTPGITVLTVLVALVTATPLTLSTASLGRPHFRQASDRIVQLRLPQDYW
jgi:hypothetical protein